MRAIVFANGEGLAGGQPPLIATPGELVLAADGGARLCRALGLVPQVAVGDFDSLTAAELAELATLGTELVRFPAEKDATDLDLALREALRRGATEAVVYGAFGRRWDHTLANLLLALAPHLAGLSLRFVDGDQSLWVLGGGQSTTVQGDPGDTVSLLPLLGEATGITTAGLAYPLDGETLELGSTRGVSNILVDREATIHLGAGRLACTHIRRGELVTHGN